MDFSIINKDFKDINPVTVGYEECKPLHEYGPAMRNYYLIHFIFEGKGVFYYDDKEVEVNKHQYFLIKPDKVTLYRADEKEPWKYLWIGFTGEIAKRFDNIELVGNIDYHIFEEVFNVASNDFEGWKDMKEEYLVTIIYKILADLNSKKEYRMHYARKAENYIKTMYMQDITVEKIAEILSLDRRYLSRIFKNRYGVTMQEYLINTRIEASKKLLDSGYSVSQTCAMCGYKDQFNFSKMFKKKCGISPNKYGK